MGFRPSYRISDRCSFDAPVGSSRSISNYSTAWLYSLSLTSGILTFVMTFVIVNAQNRNSLAAQIELDELIRAVSGASNAMINLENMNDEQLADLREKLSKLADEARQESEAIEKIKDGG